MGGTDGTRSGLCPDGAKLTKTAIHLPPSLPFDEWASTGARLCEFASASAWWLGDWLVYGERTYGTRYNVALRAAPLSYQTLRNYAWVARRFPVSRRRASLSFHHHAEVAALPDADRDLWLQRAERMRWARNELRRRLAAARRGRPPDDEQRRFVRIELDAYREHHWRQAAAAADQPLLDWLFTVADAAAESLLEAAPARLSVV